MSAGSKRTTLGRKLFITVGLIAVFGFFLALYYFIYTPRQQSFFNKSIFRIESEIAKNFTNQVKGYGEVLSNPPARTPNSIFFKNNSSLAHCSLAILDTPQEKVNKPEPIKTILDSLEENKKNKSGKTVEGIFDSIVSIHRNTFESVILLYLDSGNSGKPGEVLYRSANLLIDEEIQYDTLFEKETVYNSPVIKDINIAAVDYKLYMFPFNIVGEKFLIGGFIIRTEYKDKTQSFPVGSLVILAILLIAVLVSLPFLKIFLIGPQEIVSSGDVRSIIAMVYFIPFFFILLASALWLEYTNDIKSKSTLKSLQKEVKDSFFKEIKAAMSQLNDYDTISKTLTDTPKNKSNENITDSYLHPKRYKNFDGVFWVDDKGDEIAKWNLIKDMPVFQHKKDRQYFKDIKNNVGFRLTEPPTDTFTIQPTLAKSTGNFTINIAKKSESVFAGDTAALIGLHGKMFSVYKPVVPKGFNFCIVDAAGEILYHSQSERNRQENIFDEVDNNEALKIAVNHKDSLLLDDIQLHENTVKLLIVPLHGLPYHLITYMDKRVEFLYLLHITAFSFFCQSIVLLVIGFITLYFYYSGNKFSQLFLQQNNLEVAKPSPLKKDYYKNILFYQLVLAVVTALPVLFFSSTDFLNYVLNISILLPFFSVFGYYLIRCIENNRDIIDETKKNTSIDETKKNTSKITQTLMVLLTHPKVYKSILTAIIPYVIIILFFHFIRTDEPGAGNFWNAINILMIAFQLVFPFLAIIIAFYGFPSLISFGKNKKGDDRFYLVYFILSIMVSAFLTSVIPAIGFMLNGVDQEKILQLKAEQMHLAEKVQEHRLYVNEKTGKTKLDVTDSADSTYIHRFKYSYGLYLKDNRLCDQQNWSYSNDSVFSNSIFYKNITRFLFLPQDHADYFENTWNYYYWKYRILRVGKKLLRLHYKNLTDYKDSTHMIISAPLPDQPSFAGIFNQKYKSSRILLLVLSVVLFFVAFYKILLAISKRIFMINFFDETPGKEQDGSFIDKKYFNDKTFDKFEEAFWKDSTVSAQLISEKETDKCLDNRQREECILKIQSLLASTYEKIWLDLSPREQFVIYDFAMDYFTNYKNADILYSLYKKGILKKKDSYFVLMSESFRNYIITKSGSEEIYKLKQEISAGGTWGNFRTVLLILIFAVGVFLFIVQEDVSKRVFAIATGLGTLVPFILNLFNRNLAGSNDEPVKS